MQLTLSVKVFTPAFYIQYFKLLETWEKEGQKPTKEMVGKAQAYFATIGAGPL